METIKSAVGLGKTKEQEEEPVSGETGTGTTEEPYDAGNSSEAHEIAKAQPEQQHTQDVQDTQVSQSTEDTVATDSSSAGGSSWLKSVNPFNKSQETPNEQASTGAPNGDTSSSAAAPVEDESNLPPNHLGVNVPEGQSLDLAPPQPEKAPDSPTESRKQQKMPVTESSPPVDQNEPPRSGSASKPPPTQLRGSRASMAAPAGTRIFNPAGQNPGRIPTAGGVPVGGAATERRKSMWSSTDETKAEMPQLDKQGSPDPVTANNTVANTVPQNSNGEGSSNGNTTSAAPPAAREPKPDFNTFAWGEGGEGAAAAKEAELNGSKAGTSTKTDDSSAAPSKAEQVKDKVVPSNGNANSGAEKKERRASKFGAFKDKLGIGKKS